MESEKPKVVLVIPNYNTVHQNAPYSLGCLSSFLKVNGIDCKILDGVRLNCSNEKLVELISKENPSIVGISCLSSFYNESKELAVLLKKNGQKVFMGGHHPSFMPYETLKETGCDYVICGFGELAITKLIKQNYGNEGIKGVYKLADFKSETDEFEFAECVENLDELPFADWEEIQPLKYQSSPWGLFTKNSPFAQIVTQRGCRFRCTFCGASTFSNHSLLKRSPENVLEELKYLKNNFGIKEIQFLDSNIISDRKNITKLCNLMIESGLNMSWSCPNGIRAHMLDEELAVLMKKAGCYLVAFGIESSDPQILKNIKKDETIEQITEAINITHKVGLISVGFFILGLPGETKETIENTIKYAVNVPLDRAQFTVLDVFPGSELWTCSGKDTKIMDAKTSYFKPAIVSDELTEEYILQAQRKAILRFYSKPRRWFNFLKSIRFHQLKYAYARIPQYLHFERREN